MPLRDGDWYKKEMDSIPKKKYSKELLAQREYNSIVNGKEVKEYVGYGKTEDERLVHSLILHPLIG